MALLLGTDEAGYGPNLGPLVVTATLWRIPDELDSTTSEFEHLFRDLKSLRIDDSKQVYDSQTKSLKELEKAALSLVSLLGPQPVNLEKLLGVIAQNSNSGDKLICWKEGLGLKVPRDANGQEIERCRDELREFLSSQKIELVDVRSEVVFPERFNQLSEKLGNKATLLSTVTLELVDQLLSENQGWDSRLEILCDKHGGRSKYVHFINDILTENFVQIEQEALQESRYSIDGFHPTRIRFTSNGERFFPVACASIVSKYIRELTMIGWNDFWKKKVGEIQPTAGYPVDAKRFFGEIESAATSLGMAKDSIWRNR